jgi:hypothetical protein
VIVLVTVTVLVTTFVAGLLEVAGAVGVVCEVLVCVLVLLLGAFGAGGVPSLGNCLAGGPTSVGLNGFETDVDVLVVVVLAPHAASTSAGPTTAAHLAIPLNMRVKA